MACNLFCLPFRRPEGGNQPGARERAARTPLRSCVTNARPASPGRDALPTRAARRAIRYVARPPAALGGDGACVCPPPARIPICAEWRCSCGEVGFAARACPAPSPSQAGGDSHARLPPAPFLWGKRQVRGRAAKDASLAVTIANRRMRGLSPRPLVGFGLRRGLLRSIKFKV